MIFGSQKANGQSKTLFSAVYFLQHKNIAFVSNKRKIIQLFDAFRWIGMNKGTSVPSAKTKTMLESPWMCAIISE